MSGTAHEVRLSSRLTPFLRTVFPTVWLVGLGAATLVELSTSVASALVPALLAVASAFWFRNSSFLLCDVWAGADGLFVRRGSRAARIPYAGVRDATQRHRFGFSEVLLHEPSVFGTVILFVPYLAQLYPHQAEHPATLLIRRRVVETGRNESSRRSAVVSGEAS